MNSFSYQLTPCADKSVVKCFGMGDRCSFFHMALIELNERTRVFLSISPIDAMWKNEHLSPILKHFTTDLSAQGVKTTLRMFWWVIALFCHNRLISLLFHKPVASILPKICPAACIRATVTPNRLLFGIPIRTSLTWSHVEEMKSLSNTTIESFINMMKLNIEMICCFLFISFWTGLLIIHFFFLFTQRNYLLSWWIEIKHSTLGIES